MEIKVIGRKMQVSDSLRDYALEKVGNSMKVFDIEPMAAEVLLHVEKNPANPKNKVAEVTLRTKGHVIRAEEAEEDMYAAIDLVSEKVQRQLRKYKTRVIDKRSRVKLAEQSISELPPVAPASQIIDEEEEIVRVKYVDLPSLSEEEALIETDLLGHDFFVYNDAVTGLTNVIYHRKGGGYGIIKPRIEQHLE